MTTISVLLVDDHTVVRSGLKALLGTQPDIAVVAEAASGEEALIAAAEYSPDVVLMDLAMGPGMDGIEAIKQLRERRPRQAIIVFTTYDSDADIVRSVDAGAMGYLLKDAAPDEIFSAAIVDRTESFRPGDLLVLYTDGLTETPNEEEKEFAGPRLAEAR